MNKLQRETIRKQLTAIKEELPNINGIPGRIEVIEKTLKQEAIGMMQRGKARWSWNQKQKEEQ